LTNASTPSFASGRAERKISLPSVTVTRTSGETMTVFSRRQRGGRRQDRGKEKGPGNRHA
jgi:hypothetical protein